MFDIGLYGSGSYLIEFTVQAPILSEFTVQAPTVDDINPELHQNKKNILYNSHLRSLRSCSIHIINSIFGLLCCSPKTQLVRGTLSPMPPAQMCRSEHHRTIGGTDSRDYSVSLRVAYGFD